MMHLFLADYEMLMLAVSLTPPLIDLPLAIKDANSGLERFRSMVKNTMDVRFLGDMNAANLTHARRAFNGSRLLIF
jgi:hypothetical protein